MIEIENLVQWIDLLAEVGDLSQDDLNRKHQLRSEHFNILHELEIYWKQRSRIQWLKAGDLNTAFFHKMVNFRRRINNISSLSIDGVFSESPVSISLAIENYFKNLYNKHVCQVMSLNWDLLLPVKILEPAKLVAPFSEEEIKKSVDSLLGEKSPGPNGFRLCFFQHFWQNLKADIFDMFDQFFLASDVNTLKCINQTFITLIPKKAHAKKV